MNKRPLFYLLLVLLICQVTINLGRSVTLFPFLHYAMYSESFRQPDSIKVFEIIVNQQILLADKYRIYEWNMINQPLIAFEKQIATKDFSFDKGKMENAMDLIHLSSLYKAARPNLNNTMNLYTQFPYWYKQYLQKITKQSISGLSVNICYYTYYKARYSLISRKEWIKI